MRRVLLALLLLLVAASPAATEETWCLANPTVCLCSEPFNMTSLSHVADGWNPNDSTTKECTGESAFPNSPISTGPLTTDIQVRSDATALNALPNRDTAAVQRYVSRNEGHEGTWYIGHGLNSGTSLVPANLVRVEMRIYQWYTGNTEFAGEGTCFNSKITQHENDQKVDLDTSSANAWHLYNYFQGSPSFDCCPANTPWAIGANPPSKSQLRGKWWRHSYVMTARSGPGWRLQHFMRNVTDNLPEVAVIDSTAPGPSESQRQAWVPNSIMTGILTNAHRAGGCAGYYGFRNLVYAGWTTNSGQRIGPAGEMETGGGGPVPEAPSAPINPTIGPSALAPLGDSYRAALLTLVGLLALALHRGRRRA